MRLTAIVIESSCLRRLAENSVMRVCYAKFMASVKPKFLISSTGRKEGVVLRLGEYRRLLDRIEDLEDAVLLDRAEKSSTQLIPYTEVRERLKRAGKL